MYALVTQIEQRSEVSDLGSFGSIPDLGRLQELDDRIDDLNTAFLALALITGVTFIVWMWRAAKNNAALGRSQPRFGPGWAIGGWLIPLANLVIPVLIMQDLWRGSDASIPRGDSRWKIGDRSVLVGFWWGLLLFGRVMIGAGGATINQGSLDDLKSGVELEIVGSLCTLAAVVLAVHVVRKITQRQQECLRAQQAPPPPPGS